MRYLLAAASVFALTACNFTSTDEIEGSGNSDKSAVSNAGGENLADTMASNDPRVGQSAQSVILDSEDRPIMQLQVVLDRRGFGPGVIDGKMGLSTENALRGFQEANALDETGKLDEPTTAQLERWSNIAATRVVRIPKEWGELKYTDIPEDTAEKARLEELGYISLDEKLAERFHTTIDVLKVLNPGGKPATKSDPTGVRVAANPSPVPTAANTEGAERNGANAEPSFFVAGQQIRVPNVGADKIAPGTSVDESWQETLAALGVGTEQPKVARVVVSEKAGTLRAFDADDKLVALFTVTTGSRNDPLPLGTWSVNGVGHNPTFSYNPELFWDVPDKNEKLQMPAGPNGPVGVVWIDLTKEHYGIHGTPDPETIGRVQSHGCVRLTNWDAARLAGMVSTTTKVLFKA